MTYCTYHQGTDSSINFCGVEFNLPSAAIAISPLIPIKLAVDTQCCKDANRLTADVAIKFLMRTLGNESLKTATEEQTALNISCFTEAYQFITGLPVLAKRNTRL